MKNKKDVVLNKKIKSNQLFYFSDRIINVVLSVIAILIGLVCIYPVLHTLWASISSPEYVRANKGLLLYPVDVTFWGYKLIFQNNGIVISLLNSLFYVVAGVAYSMLFTIVCAYVLSRKLMLNGLFMKLIVFTMFFSGGLLPSYMLIRDLGLIDSRLALILPYAISAWNMIILRTAFMEVPQEIIDSAELDGAGNLQVMVVICLPLIKATVAIITLYYTVGAWNSWFPAMIYLRDRDKYPLQLLIREIMILNDTSKLNIDNITQSEEVLNNRQLIKYCSTIVAMMPMMVIFPFVQKYFQDGVFVGSIKA